MGVRATIIKKYALEYGDSCGFNYGMEFLANLIGDFCPTAWLGGEDNSSDAIWEVPRNEFVDMVAEIKAMPDKTFTKKVKDEWSTCFLDDDLKENTKEYVISKFNEWLDESDPDDDYIRFGWL